MTYVLAEAEQKRYLSFAADVEVLCIDAANFAASIAAERFREIIRGEAGSFGAVFDDKSFDSIIDAIESQKAQAYFLVAKWGVYQPYIIGASLHFSSIITQRQGDGFRHIPAPYIEDICISRKLLSNFMRETDAFFPKNCELGACFLSETARLSAQACHNETTRFIGEYAANGKMIINVFRQLNSNLGAIEDSAVLEISHLVDIMKDDPDLSICTKELGNEFYPKEHITHSNVFIISWVDEVLKESIVASFSNTISTFSGKSVIRVQITSNGCPEDEYKLRKVIFSLLAAGAKEAQRRLWISNQSMMRVHAFNEPPIVQALKDMGAAPRLLGNNIMLPVIGGI